MGIESAIVNNMFRMGVVNKEDMAVFHTYDNQYRFELSREPTQLWQTNFSSKFKCIIDIYDNITNNLLVRLNCNENNIIELIDCYDQAGQFGLSNINAPALTPYNANGNCYIIELIMYKVDNFRDVMEDLSSRWINIKEYNPIQRTTVDILSIQMDVSEIEDLMDLMYFIFLVDQEEKFGIVPVDTFYPTETSDFSNINIKDKKGE